MLGDWSCCVVVMLRCCLFCLVVAHAFSFKPGERPFQCPHCSSGYIQRASLQEHVKRKHQQLADSILPSASLPTTAQPTEKKLLACKYCQKGSHPPRGCGAGSFTAGSGLCRIRHEECGSGSRKQISLKIGKKC